MDKDLWKNLVIKMIYLLSPQEKEGCMHLPMISFSLIEVPLELSGYDFLLFTSKQAVISTEKLNPEWKKVPAIAIGEATSRQIKSLGGTVMHQAKSFYAKTLSEDLLSVFKTKKIVYLRPKVVSFDTQKYLATQGMEIEEKVIYETECMVYKSEDKPPKNAIIIFTSPSTIRCFLNNFTWDDSYTAVVIGEATKKHLPKCASVEVSDVPLIDACVRKAKEVLLSSNSK